jgi:hypothetical protein
VQVSTVAFGGPGLVDEALLNNIRLYYSGAIPGMTYNISTDPEEVKYFFLQSLDDLYALNFACPAPVLVDCPPGQEFDLNPNERKLIVIQSWATAAGATNFNLQRRSSTATTWPTWPTGQQTCSVQDFENVTVGFAVCVVNNPPAGRWRAVDGSGIPLTTPSRQFVLVDLNLGAHFAIEQKRFGTGDRIKLTADVREAGAPVTHDPVGHPVDVRVRVSRPGESAGTYVSVHTLDSCEPQPPKLPPIPKDSPFGRPSADGASSYTCRLPRSAAAPVCQN